MIVAEERFEDVYAEAYDLFIEHWNELALHKDARPLNLDFKKIRDMNRSGGLPTFTARINGILVGYASFAVSFHPRYKTWKVASNDTVFIRKSYRRHKGVVVSFFTQLEELLRDMNVNSIVYFDKIHKSRESVFAHFGYKAIEQVYEKVL